VLQYMSILLHRGIALSGVCVAVCCSVLLCVAIYVNPFASRNCVIRYVCVREKLCVSMCM